MKWNKQSIFLLGALTIILGLLLYYGNKTVIETPKVAYESSNRILSEQQQLLGNVSNIDGSEDTLTDSLVQLNEKVPNSTDPSQWMNAVKRAADNHQLTIQALNRMEDSAETETAESIENLTMIPYQLTVSYENLEMLNSFIEEVYQLTQKTAITALTYEQEEGKEATLFLTTYSLSSLAE